MLGMGYIKREEWLSLLGVLSLFLSHRNLIEDRFLVLHILFLLTDLLLLCMKEKEL